ncbi:hemimethylated DNA-binding domain protein [Ceratobasidium sp. AG-Ba]|nr:hemimethylated DNA-binding domain protein [Ceratobasidium sp. AG-Ba]
MMSVLSIPEVALDILGHLSPSRYDDTSVRTLIACTKTSRVLREAAQTDSLWVAHYRVRWTKPELDDNEQRQWYRIYCMRRETDVQTLSLLDTIITAPSKRGASAVILNERKEYVWDVLRMEATCRVPEEMREVWKKEEEQWAGERWVGIGEEWKDGTGKKEFEDEHERQIDVREIKQDWVQRRWWAKQMLGTMARADGLVSMIKIFCGDEPDPTSIENARNFEEGLKALSGLMGMNTAEA